MGFFDVPQTQRSPMGIVCLVLGIVGLGGLGTIIAGVMGKSDVTTHVIRGILQLVIPFLGWLWGFIDGIRIFIKST